MELLNIKNIELGYMIHKCELKNVVIVYSGKCCVTSDIQGLSSVLYGSDKWTESLRKQLIRKDVTVYGSKRKFT